MRQRVAQSKDGCQYRISVSLEHEGRIVDFEGVDRQFGHNYASEYVLRVVGEPIKEIYRVIREASSSAFGVVPGAFPPTLGSGMAEFRWKVIPSNPSEDQMTEIFAKAIEDSTVRKDASLGAKPTAVSASPQDASSIEPQSQLVKRVCSFCQEAPGEVECDRCHGMFCYRHVNSYAHDCLELERKPETEHPIIATNRPHGSDRRWLIAVALVLLLVGAAGYGLYRSVGPSSSIGNQTANGSTSGSPSPPGGNTMTATPSTSFESMAVSNPSISDGKANITYPSQYSELSDFALASINKDRSDFGIGPVTLSSIPSGQQHADSMLYSGYFSHWDTQGYKPYMRFVLLGGKGAVAENIAYYGGSCPPGYSCDWSFTSLEAVESQITQSEHDMVYNDSTCCDNGHRFEILNPSNTQVSIGIAFNATDFFFVEDFVNSHATFQTLSYDPNSQTVSIIGSSSATLDPSGAEIQLFYDPLPVPVAPGVLDPTFHSLFFVSILPICVPFSKEVGSYNFPNDGCTNYQGSYGAGYSLGLVVYKQPCPQSYICTYPVQTADDEVQAYASTWQVTNNSFDIQFSLSDFTRFFGGGVYTVYFYPSLTSNQTLVTYSVFIGS